MKHLLLFFTIIINLIGLAQKINTEKSIVNFTVPKTEGTIVGMEGNVALDIDDISNSKFNVSIDPNTINTGNKKRDKHLRTEDFFYVEMFPKITFKSKSVYKTRAGYATKGNISLHGISKEVIINFTIVETEGETTLIGHLSINQKDYEMAKKDKMVEVKITCVLMK